MAILVNLIDRIRWQAIKGCKMPDVWILRKDSIAKSKDESNEEKTYYSQISLMKLNNVSLFHEIQAAYASKYPGVYHLLTRQNSPGNWNNLPGNSG